MSEQLLSGSSEDSQVGPEKELSTSSSRQSDSPSDSGVFAALDGVEESDEYWEKVAEEKVREFEAYRDVHPCIVTKSEQ